MPTPSTRARKRATVGAVFTTTSLSTMAFAAAGAVRLESLPYFRGLDYI